VAGGESECVSLMTFGVMCDNTEFYSAVCGYNMFLYGGVYITMRRFSNRIVRSLYVNMFKLRVI